MIKLSFIGNLGRDAEYKEFNGVKYITFNVAVTKRYKDAGGVQHENTTWISCTKRGESPLIEYLKKGEKVYVEGDMSVRAFTTQQGEVQAGVDCRVGMVELCGGRPKDAQTGGVVQVQPVQTAEMPPMPDPMLPLEPTGDVVPF